MINAWLNLPLVPLFLLLAIGFMAVALAIYWLTAGRPAAFVGRFIGVVPPFIAVLATLLALLTGFVASDTWERDRQAVRIVQAEADDLLAVHDLSLAAAPDMSAIRRALHAYARAVVADEWPKMNRGEASASTAQALGVLLQDVAQPQIATEAGAPTQAALLNSVLRLRSDRGARLALNETQTDVSKWLTLLILGLLTQVSIGIVHLDKPRAQAAALAIFTLGLTATLYLIAAHELPFRGAEVVRPDALVRADDLVAAAIAPPTKP